MIMSNIHAIHRRMENFLGYNPDNEIRPDTKGASYSEVQESEWRRRNRLRNNNYKFKNEEEKAEVLAEIGVDYEKNLIYNLPHEAYKYQNREGKTKFFRYQSRGKK